jgi:lysozyme
MKTDEQGCNLIKGFESIHDGNLSKVGLQPKLCPAGVWTVGYGHALFLNGKPLKKDDFWKIAKYFPQFENMTLENANQLLAQDLVKYENIVFKNLKRPVDQNEFDALVSYTFNCGYSDTMFRLINSYASDNSLCDWWEKHYITAEGVLLPGLIRRRKSEYVLFSTGELNFNP